jgi:hypothetical protein
MRNQIFDFRRAVAATQEPGAGGGGDSGGAGSMYGAGGTGKMAARLGQQQQQPVETAVEAAPELPEGWTELSDPSTGKAYFHNANTNETTWERPALVLADHLGENATGKLYGGAKGWAKERGVAKFTPQHRVVSARMGQVGGGGADGDDDANGPATYI